MLQGMVQAFERETVGIQGHSSGEHKDRVGKPWLRATFRIRIHLSGFISLILWCTELYPCHMCNRLFVLHNYSKTDKVFIKWYLLSERPPMNECLNAEL